MHSNNLSCSSFRLIFTTSHMGLQNNRSNTLWFMMLNLMIWPFTLKYTIVYPSESHQWDRDELYPDSNGSYEFWRTSAAVWSHVWISMPTVKGISSHEQLTHISSSVFDWGEFSSVKSCRDLALGRPRRRKIRSASRWHQKRKFTGKMGKRLCCCTNNRRVRYNVHTCSSNRTLSSRWTYCSWTRTWFRRWSVSCMWWS